MRLPPVAVPERPLGGARVLLTRARKDSAGLRARLEDLGATVYELPVVEIVPPADTAGLESALRNLPAYDWIAFSSRNAVRAVFDRLAALQLPVRLPSGLRVAAVGPSTASELEARGVHVDCVPAEATSAELAAEMSHHGVENAKVLLPVGDLARTDLEEGLRRAGAHVERAVAYRTVRPADVDLSALDALLKGGIDVLALASPSAIRNLVELLGTHLEESPEETVTALRHVRIVCIGPSTAAAVRELQLEPAAIAQPHTIDGLVESIAELCTRESFIGHH